jgi:excinuclease ABC subunit C
MHTLSSLIAAQIHRKKAYATRLLDLNSTAEFDPSRDADFFAALPEAPAVVRIEPRPDFANARPFLIRTANLRSRMKRLLARRDPNDPVAAKRLSLRDYASAIRYRVAGSIFELGFIHWQHARQLYPRAYREKLHLRSPALIKMAIENAYPRCYVTRQIRTNSAGNPARGFYFGPFSSRRAAENFSSEFLNLFKLRRCQIKIRRDPAFPGCIYSEMKMCLAPCFAGCTDDEYSREAKRVHEFLETCGASLAAEIETEREAASADLDFERAAELHRRLEKIQDVLRPLPELARSIENLDAVVLQRAAEPEAVAVFVIRSGWIAEPFLLHFGQSAEPRSAEEILREVLGTEPPAAAASEVAPPLRESDEPLADHLALLARWFFSKPRHGEIFYRDKDWPYRRLIRACSRLLTEPIKNGPKRK